MKRPQLGSWHMITERAKKVRDGNQVHWQAVDIEDKDARCGRLDYPDAKISSIHYVQGDGRQWQPAPPIVSHRAMYIGYRYKFNGKWEADMVMRHHDDPGEPYFNQSEAVEVWMFVTHENRKPIPVFPFEWEQK